MCSLEVVSGGVDGELPGDGAHGGEDRKSSVGVGDGFVGDSEYGFLKQCVRKRKIGCEVEKCEEYGVF